GQSTDDIRRLYEPLLDYLGRATNAKITIVTARNYEDMVHYFADGRVDFGTISPAPYVLTQQLNPGVKLLLTELSSDPTHTKRVASYQGMIVTLRARNDINTLDDLRWDSSAKSRRAVSSFLVRICSRSASTTKMISAATPFSGAIRGPRTPSWRAAWMLQPHGTSISTRLFRSTGMSSRSSFRPPSPISRSRLPHHSQAQSVRRSRRPSSTSTTRPSRGCRRQVTLSGRRASTTRYAGSLQKRRIESAAV